MNLKKIANLKKLKIKKSKAKKEGQIKKEKGKKPKWKTIENALEASNTCLLFVWKGREENVAFGTFGWTSISFSLCYGSRTDQQNTPS